MWNSLQLYTSSNWKQNFRINMNFLMLQRIIEPSNSNSRQSLSFPFLSSTRYYYIVFQVQEDSTSTATGYSDKYVSSWYQTLTLNSWGVSAFHICLPNLYTVSVGREECNRFHGKLLLCPAEVDGKKCFAASQSLAVLLQPSQAPTLPYEPLVFANSRDWVIPSRRNPSGVIRMRMSSVSVSKECDKQNYERQRRVFNPFRSSVPFINIIVPSAINS
jgi:hypothetical protein